MSLHDQLLAARPDDLFVRWSMSAPEQIFINGASVASLRHHHRSGKTWLTVASDDAHECAELVLPLLQQLRPAGITVPLELTPALGLPVGDRWMFWVTTTRTHHVPHHPVIEVAHDDPRLRNLLTHSHSAEHEPGGMPPVRWLGIEINDELVSVGAQTALREPAGHIAAVVTHQAWRGQGLARDVCAVLLNTMLDSGKPAVCLGMWADNTAANSVYTTLGFTQTGVRNSVDLHS